MNQSASNKAFSRSVNQSGRLSSQLFFWSIVSALAGFLFGFDTVVISGAEQSIQELWKLDATIHGLMTGAALWGTVVGSLIGAWPTDKIGRKPTLVWIGILYFASAVWSGLASGPTTFFIARFIGGLGVGISTVASPLFISEIAPPKRRGLLAGLFQFNIVFGILVAYLSNWAFSGIGEHAWRWMLGIEALPAIIYTIMCFTLPESPRWLITQQDDRDSARRILQSIEPEKGREDIEKLIDQIAHSSQQDNLSARSATSLSKPIILAFLIAFFNQLSGINAILYFSKRIFESAGFGDEAAFLNSVGIGFTNLIFTFIGLWLIDRLGRRTLLYIGSVGYIVSLALCSYGFATKMTTIIPWCIFAFIAAHAMGQGAVIWVFISEIFPNKFRAMGQSIGSATHWVFAAAIASAFPIVAEQLSQSVIFGFFSFMMVLQLLWVWLMMPETKGISLEEMNEKLA